jgi:hypothetical protein
MQIRAYVTALVYIDVIGDLNKREQRDVAYEVIRNCELKYYYNRGNGDVQLNHIDMYEVDSVEVLD